MHDDKCSSDDSWEVVEAYPTAVCAVAASAVAEEADVQSLVEGLDSSARASRPMLSLAMATASVILRKCLNKSHFLSYAALHLSMRNSAVIPPYDWLWTWQAYSFLVSIFTLSAQFLHHAVVPHASSVRAAEVEALLAADAAAAREQREAAAAAEAARREAAAAERKERERAAQLRSEEKRTERAQREKEKADRRYVALHVTGITARAVDVGVWCTR